MMDLLFAADHDSPFSRNQRVAAALTIGWLAEGIRDERGLHGNVTCSDAGEPEIVVFSELTRRYLMIAVKSGGHRLVVGSDEAHCDEATRVFALGGAEGIRALGRWVSAPPGPGRPGARTG